MVQVQVPVPDNLRAALQLSDEELACEFRTVRCGETL